MKANEWIGIVSERLQRQWPTIEAARLDDLAADLWRDEKLRAMDPERAAGQWLRPVAASIGIGIDGDGRGAAAAVDGPREARSHDAAASASG